MRGKVDLTAPPPSGNGWSEWGNHVLAELERLNNAFESLRHETSKIHVDIATLKVKSGMWGAIGALIPIALALGVALILHFTKGSK